MRWRFGGKSAAFALFISSFPRKRESRASALLPPWTPAFAGVTIKILCVMVVLLVCSPARAEDKIRFSYVVPTIDYTPLLVAIDKGYFTDEGIAVELVQAQGGIATPALISGDLDFSFAQKALAELKAAHWQPPQ